MFTAHIKASPRQVSDFRPDVDTELEKLIAHCLAKDPEHRPKAPDVVRRLEGGAPSPTPPPDTGQQSLLTKLVKRRVPHVLAVFAPAGFLIVELVGQLEHIELVPPAVHRLTLVTYLVGLPGAAIAAWYHGEVGPQKSRRLEWGLYGILAAIWLVACGLVLF
jgi:hypothetical protein